MSDRRWFLGAALALIGLPVAVVQVEAASWFAANRHNGSFESSGVEREYLLYVPKSYDRTRPTPLVISLHGAAIWAAVQRDMSRWNDVADKEGFIVVYPSGTGRRVARVWHEGERPGVSKDVTFIAALIDTLSAHYNIDPARVYANGLSNGGGMSFALSCSLSDRIAAVGLVASAQFLPFQWCDNPHPVPMINFHGTADPEAPYTGGTTWVAPNSKHLQNQPRFVANWARRNGCAASPTDSLVAPDVTRRTYSRCTNDAAVVFYTIHGGGHSWPGGGRVPEWFAGSTTNSINASHLMWEFFRQHPLRNRNNSKNNNSRIRIIRIDRSVSRNDSCCHSDNSDPAVVLFSSTAPDMAWQTCSPLAAQQPLPRPQRARPRCPTPSPAEPESRRTSRHRRATRRDRST
jgi:polyhydroxybutyrate depolymerase